MTQSQQLRGTLQNLCLHYNVARTVRNSEQEQREISISQMNDEKGET